MSETVSESRFYMWRAVIALAHADQKVTSEERALAEQYLQNVPFSKEQKGILREDMENPQSIADMFDKISAPEDQAGFFEFARMILWCDGDYDRQEEIIFEHLKETQMNRVDNPGLQKMVQDTRESGEVERMRQDESFEKDAQERVGFSRIFSRLLHLH